METKDHVVSLEAAKRLKEIGVDQLSEFMWMQVNGEWDIYYHIDRRFSAMSQAEWEAAVRTGCAAFLVTELIAILGDNFGVLDHLRNGQWGCYIPNDCGVNGIADTPADALAALVEILHDRE